RRSLPAASECRLPLSGISHRFPRFLRGLGRASLQQLDRMLVGRAHKGHDAVTRRPADGNAGLHTAVARLANVIDLIGQVPKKTSLAIVLGIPVVGELDLQPWPADF